MPTPASQSEVLDRLRDWIGTGRLPGDYPLPSERELSAQLGTHRTTVRRAISALADEGLLRRDGRRVVVAVRKSVWMSKTVALVLPRPVPQHSPAVNRDWASFVTLDMTRAVHNAGLHALSLNVAELTESTLRRLAADQPMGVAVPEVFMGGDATLELIRTLQSHGLRVVVASGDPRCDGFDRVTSDHEQGGYLLTRRLLDMGCRKLACLWRPPHATYWYQGRARGMQRAAAEAGIAPVPIHSTPDRPIPVSPTDWDHYARIEAGHLLAAFGPKLDVDAIMVTSDRDAFITAAAVRLFGKEPGRDVLIAGYDNTYTLCEEHASEPSMPTLTVDKRRELTGEMMIQLLTDRASGRLPDAPQVRAVPPVVIEVRGDPARARPETSPGSEDPV